MILYSGVDRTPPCLTPCFNAKLSLNEPNHFTSVVKPLYSSLMINQYVVLMFRSSSLSRRIVCCTTSNADCTSSVAKNSVDLVCYASAFASVMMRLDMIGDRPLVNPYEPVHEISNNEVCATSKASDQPAHTRSLIRAFASRLSIL